MALRKSILLFCFSLLALSASSQKPEYSADSTKAQQLIADKIEQLKTSGVSEYLYLFSDAGLLVILYKKDRKIKGTLNSVYYKPGSRFNNIRLTKQDKSNYAKCIDKARLDTTINFSGCRDDVHSFRRIFFSTISPKHSLKGTFTTDCWEKLEKNDLRYLSDIYHHIQSRYWVKFQD